MPLSAAVQVGGLGVDVDGLGNAPPKPVTLLVKDRDRGLIDLVVVVVDVVSDWRGGALMLISSDPKSPFSFADVGGGTVLALYFIHNPGLVKLVHLVFSVFVGLRWTWTPVWRMLRAIASVVEPT